MRNIARIPVLALALALALLLPLLLVTAPQAWAELRNIAPVEAVQLIQERGNLLILDIRTPKERARGTIANSTLVTVWDIAYNRVQLPADKPLLLFCATGGRSFMAGQLLARRGHREVFNLAGGIVDWHKQGLPIVK